MIPLMLGVAGLVFVVVGIATTLRSDDATMIATWELMLGLMFVVVGLVVHFST